ncbi:MAG: hypothetical protein J5I81_00360 [Nitrococcus mobilis]|nr:hypothetical protein [Nitrococcus mobilis]
MPVDLDLATVRRVVENEGGCLVWGGAAGLSPADDVLIRVEHALDVDASGQLIASVLSKKLAAGASHAIIDIPVGPTAKIRSPEQATWVTREFGVIGRALGLVLRLHLSDGSAPVGHGIGPALEARDVLAVLRGEPGAPADLRERSLGLAASLLELGGKAPEGEGSERAAELLDTMAAYHKLLAIGQAQGGLREPPVARYRRSLVAARTGYVGGFDNRAIARLAKLAGAPAAPAAGVELMVRSGQAVEQGAPLLVLHAEFEGELAYALDFWEQRPGIVSVCENIPGSAAGA